jgi:hypothetical protein
VETTLHHQLKDFFREPDAPIEVQLGRFRIDVINRDRLVEIQRSGLASIRKKIETLLGDGFRVDVIKPLVLKKQLIKLNARNGREVDRRWSPLNGSILDLFDELLYFTRTFPHPHLRLITPLITIEEIRYPGHGRRRRHRQSDFQVLDRRILDIHETHCFSNALDLGQLLPADLLSQEFGTVDLARALSVDRYQAQKIAYVLRKTGAVIDTGKIRNAIQYRSVTAGESKRALTLKLPDAAQRKQAKTFLKNAIEKHQSKAA